MMASDGMTNKTYKCFNCESVARFPGLCRECTEYTDEGNIITPIQRKRVNESGEEWKPMTNHIQQLTRDGLPVKKGFRTPKKLSKKQAKKVADEIKQQKYWNTEIVKKMADDVGEDGIIELGEYGGEEE
tara:strand:+ start:973 stop:1359 length:387 start_codon:yes stop_codon:yes gene_type:complete